MGVENQISCGKTKCQGRNSRSYSTPEGKGRYLRRPSLWKDPEGWLPHIRENSVDHDFIKTIKMRANVVDKFIANVITRNFLCHAHVMRFVWKGYHAAGINWRNNKRTSKGRKLGAHVLCFFTDFTSQFSRHTLFIHHAFFPVTNTVMG